MVTLASYFIDQLLREGTLLPLSDASTATHSHNAVVWYGMVRYVMCHRIPVSGVARNFFPGKQNSGVLRTEASEADDFMIID